MIEMTNVRAFIAELPRVNAIPCDMGKARIWPEHEKASHSVIVGDLAFFLCPECVSKVRSER